MFTHQETQTPNGLKRLLKNNFVGLHSRIKKEFQMP
jgi:hypothetical protein